MAANTCCPPRPRHWPHSGTGSCTHSQWRTQPCPRAPRPATRQHLRNPDQHVSHNDSSALLLLICMAGHGAGAQQQHSAKCQQSSCPSPDDMGYMALLVHHRSHNNNIRFGRSLASKPPRQHAKRCLRNLLLRLTKGSETNFQPPGPAQTARCRWAPGPGRRASGAGCGGGPRAPAPAPSMSSS